MLCAIHRFHRQGPTAARQHLQHLISAHLRNVSRIAQIEEDLQSYIRWASDANLIVADSKIRINLDVRGFLTLGGEVSRLDVTDAGYRAVILGDKPVGWKRHLRLPLVQRAVALKYGRPAKEITVAMQNLDGTELESISFDEQEIREAEDNFNILGESVRRLAPPF